MKFLMKTFELCVLVGLAACSLDLEDNSDYCPVATKLIPLQMKVDFKCAPKKECFQYPVQLELGYVSRYLDIDCWGGIYKYTFVSGNIREEATNDYYLPHYELHPDSNNRIEFALIDKYGDEKRYNLKLTDYIPDYKIVGDTLEIDAREGVRYYYKGRKEYGNDSLLKITINDDIMPFFEFTHAERMVNDDSLVFSGTIYWK